MYVKKELLTELRTLCDDVEDALSVFFGEYGGKKPVLAELKYRGVQLEVVFAFWLRRKSKNRHNTQKNKKIQKVRAEKKVIIEKIKEVNNSLKSSDKRVDPYFGEKLAKRKEYISQIRKINRTPAGKAIRSENDRKHRGPAYQRRRLKRTELIVDKGPGLPPSEVKQVQAEKFIPKRKVVGKEWRQKETVKPTLQEVTTLEVAHGGRFLRLNARGRKMPVGEFRSFTELTERQILDLAFEGECQLGPVFLVKGRYRAPSPYPYHRVYMEEIDFTDRSKFLARRKKFISSLVKDELEKW